MIINPDSSVHVYEPCTQIEGVHSEKFAELHKYVLDAVNIWCDDNDDKEFSVRDLFGGNKADWRKTPLQSIPDYFAAAKNPEFKRAASQSVGWILKNVAHNHVRTFMLHVRSTPMYPDVNHYTWQCDEDRQRSELIGVEIR